MKFLIAQDDEVELGKRAICARLKIVRRVKVSQRTIVIIIF